MAYPLPWYEDRAQFPDRPEMWRGYTAQDYTLAYALDLEDNYAAEKEVIRSLRVANKGLLRRVSFESERGCFFAHTRTSGDMEELAAHIAALVAARNPHAVPGSILDSPATIRPWDALLDS